MVEGFRRINPRQDSRQPITPSMLAKIIGNLARICSSPYEQALFRAAFSLGYFAFLRVGEFTANSKTDPGHALHVHNIHLSADKAITINMPSSKTDQRKHGTRLNIQPCADKDICPGTAVASFLQLFRPNVGGLLFVHADGSPLTRFQLAAVLKKSLKLSGFQAGRYSTHSLRIGACTTVSNRGASEHDIKSFGRWASHRFKSYIRIPSHLLSL